MVGGIGVFIAVCLLAAWWGSQSAEGRDVGPWYGIVPPLSAIILAFVTRRVLLSLGIAICLGGLLYQIPYSLLGAAIALVCGYLPVALGLKWIASIPLGIMVIIAIFFLVGTPTNESLRKIPGPLSFINRRWAL